MSPIPMLMMKSKRPMEYTGEFVETIVGKVDMAREIEIYSMADCYVQPSRGEGFGLQPLQAIAQGIPTILTDAHGHRAFSHLGLPISAKKVPVEYNMLGFADDQYWWEPNFDELVDQMREVYNQNNNPSLVERCKVTSDHVHRQFTWERTAQGVMDSISHQLPHSDRLRLPYLGNSTIVELDQPKYLIRVNRPYRMSATGQTLVYEPGKDYYEIVDIKRLLFESDLLDPSCLTGTDTGLTDAQIATLPHYNARNAYCPTCHTRYNTGTSMTDDLLSGELSRESLKIGL